MDSLFSRRCVWVNGPIIVGAGPSGLAVAANLREQGVPFVVLERADCIAALWQKRTYDRLKLHLPKQFCELPRMPFPEHYPEYPTRRQFIDYLEDYAAKFDIKPEFNHTVLSARYDETSGLWRVHAAAAGSEMEYIGRWLVVATGENAESVVPDIPGLAGFDGEVTHVSEYKSGESYRGKRVLVVGCGNSGMEVSLDLFDHGALPSMVVRDAVHVLPREVLGKSTFELAVLLMRWLPLWLVDKIMILLAWLVLGDLAKYGLRRPAVGPLELKNTHGRTPVLDIGALARIRSGDISVVPGVARFTKCSAELADGQSLYIDAVVLATGYRSNVPQWLQGNDFFNKDGYPKTALPPGSKGLYAVGFTRRGLSGASADAVRIAKDLGQVWKEETKPTKRPGRVPQEVHLRGLLIEQSTNQYPRTSAGSNGCSPGERSNTSGVRSLGSQLRAPHEGGLSWGSVSHIGRIAFFFNVGWIYSSLAGCLGYWVKKSFFFGYNYVYVVWTLLAQHEGDTSSHSGGLSWGSVPHIGGIAFFFNVGQMYGSLAGCTGHWVKKSFFFGYNYVYVVWTPLPQHKGGTSSHSPADLPSLAHLAAA